MTAFNVTRAQLKAACEGRNWDLLDKLLELDPSGINDNALYTDTWGEWWGLLLEAVRIDSADGVRVLLKHGAARDASTWGDCAPCGALEAAKDKPEILALLQSHERPAYVRKTDPPLPADASPEEQTVNRQGEIRDEAGLVFPTQAIQLPPRR